MLAGRYGLGDPIGRHGGAVVHHGFDTILKRSVAVKIFRQYGEESADVLHEARTAAGLSHPNIAQVYDYGEIGDGDRRTPYLVMEFLDGESLADRLARTGALRWREAAEIGAGIAGALAAAHAQGLVHRGVSARTVMLAPDGVKVLDFETATATGRDSDDVDALGPLLFECLTGAPASLGEPLPRLAGLPRDLIRFYDSCGTDNRPTARSAAETLGRIAGPAPLPRPARPARSRRRAAVLASAAVVTAVLSIAGLQLANGTVTPGGRSAEAAVEAPHPAATTPHITHLAPTTTPARKAATASSGHRRKKAVTTTPAPRPTTPAAAPSTPPAATPTPSAPTPTTPVPDDTTPPADPTTAPTTPTTPAPDDTPPVTPSAEAAG